MASATFRRWKTQLKPGARSGRLGIMKPWNPSTNLARSTTKNFCKRWTMTFLTSWRIKRKKGFWVSLNLKWLVECVFRKENKFPPFTIQATPNSDPSTTITSQSNQKRHIGAMARSGWIPSFRPTLNRFSRSGRTLSRMEQIVKIPFTFTFSSLCW